MSTSTIRRPLTAAALPAQFIRFCTVGLSNTAVTLVAFWLLERTGIWYPAASAGAFFAGALNGFALNGRWTFRTQGSFPRYLGVQLTGLGIAVGLVALGVQYLHLPHLAAQMAAIPPVSVVTFTLARRVAFPVPSMG